MNGKRRWSNELAIIFATLAISGGMLAARTAEAAGDAPDQGAPDATAATSRVVAAAKAFLATLADQQRAKVLYPFDDDKQRANWSNFPTGFVPRGGLSLREMSEAQRTAALALVAAALSQRGFEKVQQIMAADQVLKTTDQGPPHFGGGQDGSHGPPPGDDQAGGFGPPPGGPGGSGGPGGGGGRPPLGGQMFGQELYYVSILGLPSEKEPWMLQFGGHHLALNITVIGEHGVLTPSLTGVQPATYTSNGKTVRPLGQENDQGFALLGALDETQRQQAILKYRVADLVLGPGRDGRTIQPEGLKVSAMNAAQQAMLLDLISQWAGIANDSFAAPRLAEIKAGLADTWFAWSGPTTVEPGKNGLAYYRIQGPKLVIEYAPQHEAEHVHTMYRDPTNDYGRALRSK